MNLSDDRINFLSHEIVRMLRANGAAAVVDEARFLSGIKQAIRDFGTLLDGIDAHIRQKIASIKRQIPEGSREWDILYRQYFEEALRKKKL